MRRRKAIVAESSKEMAEIRNQKSEVSLKPDTFHPSSVLGSRSSLIRPRSSVIAHPNPLIQLFLIILLSHISHLTSFSQTPAQLYKAGTESLDKGEYYAAARYFKTALDKDDDQAAVWFSYAEASRQFNDYVNAAKGYRGCIERDKQKEFPMAKFWLGVMLQNDGNYADAKEMLNDFKTVYRKKDFYAQKVQQLIESCAWAMANSTVNDSIEIVHEPDNINTTFSEINPIVFGDSLKHFASTKPAQGKTFKTRLYHAATGEVFLPGVDESGSKHIANGCYAESKTFGREFFFTQCGIEDGKTRCEIFVSKFENNLWQKAKPLPQNINLAGHTATHPNVAADASGNQWLIFSANRPGGKGKMDIWLSKRLSVTEWDYPQNAGTVINTADDEVTPFYDATTDMLFFSSHWHYGFGGFDVFKSKVNSFASASFEKPKNLGLPMNSSANDLYYVNTGSTAYFSSNRKGSKFVEAETCCNDVYRAEARHEMLDVRQETIGTRQKENLLNAEIREDKTDSLHQTPDTRHQTSDTGHPTSNLGHRTSDIRHLTSVNFPIRLYFHNDEPNPKTMNDTTALSYVDAYQSYINLQSEYEREFAQGLKPSEQAAARKQIQEWFADSVEMNFRKLIAFSAYMLNELEQGKQLRVTVSGYCSPLNFNEYNLRLGNRRINSVLNFFSVWRDGVLQSFINSGKLSFNLISEGEEKAPQGISDSREDLRNSVYHPLAARERRVEILKVAVD